MAEEVGPMIDMCQASLKNEEANAEVPEDGPGFGLRIERNACANPDSLWWCKRHRRAFSEVGVQYKMLDPDFRVFNFCFLCVAELLESHIGQLVEYKKPESKEVPV